MERTSALVQLSRSKPNDETVCDDAVDADRRAGDDGACDASREAETIEALTFALPRR